MGGIDLTGEASSEGGEACLDQDVQEKLETILALGELGKQEIIIGLWFIGDMMIEKSMKS